jgi:hypothetical protein
MLALDGDADAMGGGGAFEGALSAGAMLRLVHGCARLERLQLSTYDQHTLNNYTIEVVNMLREFHVGEIFNAIADVPLKTCP